MRSLAASLSTACTVLLLSAPAAAEDWGSSLFTEGGVELRADERIFTLFAALNELGLDDAPVTRRMPVPRRQYDPVRQRVRDAVQLTPALRAKFDDFFDKHPAPLRSYVALALALGPAPTFTPGALPPEAKGLGGFEKLLAEFHAAAQVGPLFKKEASAQRKALKALQPSVDAPLAKARKILKAAETDDSPRVVVGVNLLDAGGAAYGILIGVELHVVVGPGGEHPEGAAIARGFARAHLQGPSERKAGGLRGGKQLLAELSDQAGIDTSSVASYVAETLARAVEVRSAFAAGRRGAALAEEHRRGYVLIRQLDAGLTSFQKGKKSLENFLREYLREVDGLKAAAVRKGN